MVFSRGRLPSTFTAVALLCSLAVQAQHNIPLTLAEAEDLALSQEPGHAALLAHAAALEEQSVAAAQLPDPTMRVGLANYPISSGSFSTEGMTQAQLGFRQSFPAGKSREFSQQQFRSRSLELTESAVARVRDVRTSVRTA